MTAKNRPGNFPDKALTILDQAGSSVRMRSNTPQPKVTAADIRNLFHPEEQALRDEIKSCLDDLKQLIAKL